MTKISFARLSLAAAVSAIALVTAAAASAESLSDAIAMAYANNPTLGRARAQQRATDEQFVQTRSALGPSVSAGGSVSYADKDQDFFGNRSYTSLNVQASQTLFASGGIVSSIDAAKAGVLAGQQDVRSTESNVLLNVIQAYTAVRRDQAALKISQDNYDILKQQLDQTQAQFEAGQLTKTDVAQSQARLQAAAAQLASAQAQLDSDRASYVAIVGQAPVALDPEPDLPGLPADFDTALDTAQKNNPDLQAALYAEQAAQARVKAERSAFGPTVALQAGTSSSTPTNDLGSLHKNEGTSVTARFSVPLFSAGLNGARVRQAIENADAQQETTEITRRGVISQVSQAWSQMIAARSAVASNEEQVKAAQIAFEGVKTEQQVGLRTNIEVLNAEQELESAQLQLLDSQRTQYVAASQLLSVVGGLTAQAFVPDIQVYDPQQHFDQVKNKGWTPLEPVSRTLDSLATPLLGH